MKAAIIDALGQLPRFGDFAEPLAEGDEIVVTVTAASIKQLDRAIAAGTHLWQLTRTAQGIAFADNTGGAAWFGSFEVS